MKAVTPTEALRKIKSACIQGRMRISPHAFKRINQRGVRSGDVRKVILSAKEAKESSEGLERWKITGQDSDEDELTVIIVIEFDGTIVVTVY